MNRVTLFSLLGSVLLFGCLACNDEEPTPNYGSSGTGCNSNVAQIGVGDGFIENLCGCTGAGELANGVQTAPASVTCTVPSGTTVMFIYMAIQTKHQMVSTGQNTFASGQIATPSNPSTQIAAALFTASGTYTFEDAYDTVIQGQIIVP